ncbi:MAG: aegerolysin family protein [Promethearchaeota archaeon]
MTIEKILEEILEKSGLSKKEIEDLMKKKKEEYTGFLSDKAAIILVSNDLGIKLDCIHGESTIVDNLETKISDIMPNLKNIYIVGRIKEIGRVFSFKRNDGSSGQVGSFILSDDTGDIRIVLWDDQTMIFKENGFIKNEVVKIINGYSKKGRLGDVEVHVSRLGKIILSPDDVDYKKIPKIKEELIKIDKINIKSRSVSIKGQIINKYPIREFKRKDGQDGKVLSLNVMDDTGMIRVVFWNEDTEKVDNLSVGDVAIFNGLSPRESNLNPNVIELFASSNTIVKKVNEDIKIESKLVEKISDIQKENNLISFKGIISSLDDLRTVQTKNGEEVELLIFKVCDDTDSVRVSAWRDKAKIISNELNVGMGVLLKNVKIRENPILNQKEVTMINISTIEKIDLKIKDLKLHKKDDKSINKPVFKKEFTKIKLIENPGMYEIKGSIIKPLSFNDVIIYDACPNCLKKVDNCTCKEIMPSEKRMIVKALIDDETGSIRTTFFGDMAQKLLKMTPGDVQKILDDGETINQIAGKELIIRGKAEINTFNEMSRLEFKVYDFMEVDAENELEELINELGI